MINKVILLGYVGSDPEIRFFESGSNMARIRIATSEKIYIRKTNETRQHTEWHTVIFWGQTATFIDKYIRKGAQVYIEGALRNRETTNKEGVKQMMVEIYGNEIKIVNQPRNGNSQSQTTKQNESPRIVSPTDDVDNIPF
ncbi:MAG: single-stranded DNA-binding protein [Rikenellaceae bacterium]